MKFLTNKGDVYVNGKPYMEINISANVFVRGYISEER